jgi:hypothetical protein
MHVSIEKIEQGYEAGCVDLSIKGGMKMVKNRPLQLL